MTDDDDREKQPPIRLVSENPDAPDLSTRKIIRAKAQAQYALTRLAAALLRAIAGSESELNDLARRIGDYIEVQTELKATSGHFLTVEEEREALSLPKSEYPSSGSDWQKQEWLRNQGEERIVQGALRLAAHKLLGEKPSFGGKHSERLIQEGIDWIARAFKPASPSKPSGKAPKLVERFFGERLGMEKKSRGTRGPLATRDSCSYGDPPDDDKR
jgi:hypothetical protein